MAMEVTIFFLVFAVVFIFTNLYLSLRIVHDLRRRGYDASYFWMRIMIIKYAHQYKKITIEKTGEPGPFYRPWLITINGALLFALLAVLNILLMD
jgi:uncharacterized membrane protein YhaH (DUF805 family)